jgi:hypothetical protein
MSRLRLELFGPLLLACGLLVACDSTPENRHHERTQFEDIPVPMGLSLDTSTGKSFSMESGSFRYGEFVYRGDATVEDVVAFVQRRMPVQGWVLVEDNSDPLERQRFRYEKERGGAEGQKELLDVTVEGKEKLIRLTYIVRRR